MKKQKPTFILFLILLFSVLATAQDAGKSLLKWFPRGYYELMAGQDLQSIKKSELYTISGKAVASLMRDSPTMEIPGLRGKFQFAVVALLKRTQEAPYKGNRKKAGDINFDILGGDLLYAYQFNGLQPLLQKTMKNGRLRKVEGKINKRPIYGYSESGDPELYLYATATDELLAATKKAALIKMVEAGTGAGQSMMDDPVYLELEREIPESQYWVVSLPREPMRSKLDSLEDQESAEAKKIMESIAEEKKMLISGIEISDKLIYRETMYFPSEKAALKFHSEQGDNIFEWGGISLPAPAVESRNAELDGDVVKVRIDYNIKKIGEYYQDKEKRKKKKTQDKKN